VELDLVGVHIKNRLTNTVTIDGVDTTIHLPTADLEWTTAPRFVLGYRLDQGCGEFLLGYRSLVTEGRANLIDFDPAGDGFLKSRVNLNVIDLDYASQEFSLGPQFDMKWGIGVRLADLYFDSTAAGFVEEARTSNSFLGVGPHSFLDLSYHFCALPEFSLFSRVEGAVLLGEITQNYESTLGAGPVALVGGAKHIHKTQAVPTFHLQLGMAYAPSWTVNRLRFLFGYDFEQWWGVGKAEGSDADLTGNGVFLRAEINY
jgi:hypothetical protein